MSSPIDSKFSYDETISLNTGDLTPTSASAQSHDVDDALPDTALGYLSVVPFGPTPHYAINGVAPFHSLGDNRLILQDTEFNTPMLMFNSNNGSFFIIFRRSADSADRPSECLMYLAVRMPDPGTWNQVPLHEDLTTAISLSGEIVDYRAESPTSMYVIIQRHLALNYGPDSLDIAPTSPLHVSYATFANSDAARRLTSVPDPVDVNTARLLELDIEGDISQRWSSVPTPPSSPCSISPSDFSSGRMSPVAPYLARARMELIPTPSPPTTPDLIDDIPPPVSSCPSLVSVSELPTDWSPPYTPSASPDPSAIAPAVLDHSVDYPSSVQYFPITVHRHPRIPLKTMSASQIEDLLLHATRFPNRFRRAMRRLNGPDLRKLDRCVRVLFRHFDGDGVEIGENKPILMVTGHDVHESGIDYTCSVRRGVTGIRTVTIRDTSIGAHANGASRVIDYWHSGAMLHPVEIAHLRGLPQYAGHNAKWLDYIPVHRHITDGVSTPEWHL